MLKLLVNISYVEDCGSLQSDLNCVYDWAKTNNMVFTIKNLSIYLFLQMHLLLVIMLAQFFMLLTMSII